MVPLSAINCGDALVAFKNRFDGMQNRMNL